MPDTNEAAPPQVPDWVELEVRGATMGFSAKGITLKPYHSPWLFGIKTVVKIPWGNVKYILPSSPKAIRDGAGWKTFKGIPITPQTFREGRVQFWYFAVGLVSREEVLASATWAGRYWLKSHIDIYQDSSKIDYLYFGEKWQCKNGDKLIKALDISEKYSRVAY